MAIAENTPVDPLPTSPSIPTVPQPKPKAVKAPKPKPAAPKPEPAKKKKQGRKGVKMLKTLGWLAFIVSVIFLARWAFKERPMTSLNGEWRKAQEWAGPGVKQGLLNQARQVGVDSKGDVYVTDRDNHRVQKFTAEGRWVRSWGGMGKNKDQFNQPFGLAVDRENNLIYVVDTWNNVVKQFDPQGKLLRLIPPKNAGFFGPRSIAIGMGGMIYITDTGHQRVIKYDGKGMYIREWGTLGAGKGQFNEPVGIAVDAQENVYVADMNNRRIQKFDKDGKFLAKWPYKGLKGNYPLEPYLSIDAENRVYLSDAGAGRFQVFTSNGKLLGAWGKDAKESPFEGPICSAFGTMDDAFVTDTNTQKIYRFIRVH